VRITTDDRAIARLAFPALGALAAEPLYVLVDTGIVGHLGVAPLAALALAGTLLGAIASLCTFLEYGATPKVGRLFAVGDHAGAAHLGRQGVLLGAAVGLLLATVTAGVAGPLVHLFGAPGRVAPLAALYLRIAAIGLPFALLSVAAEGYLRGVMRIRLPFAVLLAGNLLNAALELLFVYGFHWGIAGSAWGTVAAQAVMAAAFLALLGARDRTRPLVDFGVLRSLARTSTEILIRTAALYGAFLIAGAVLARIGAASLAAHQVVFQLWNILAFALDALAIAAQVMVSHELARADRARARYLAARILAWSLAVGVLFGLVMLALGGVLPHLFTSNPRVLNRVHAIWWIFALMQPVNGIVFALDGILIGAQDTRFLAWSMLPCTLLGFAPLAVISLGAGWGIVGVWIALYVFLIARMLVTGWRFRGEAWYSR